MWRVDLGRWLDAHPATHPPTLLNAMGAKEEMKKPMGQDKDREVARQLPSQTKEWEKADLLPVEIGLGSKEQR